MAMSTPSYRRTHTKECPYGHDCCTTDDRPSKLIRRTARRVEKQSWKRNRHEEI